MEGIENAIKLNYIYFDNTSGETNITYTNLRTATKLKELYFYMPTDIEVEKMCTEMSNSDYELLDTIGLYGYVPDRYINGISFSGDKEAVTSNLTSVQSLNLLKDSTKSKVKVLYINNNKLTNLNGIQGFSGLEKLWDESVYRKNE